jgi:CARDB
VKSATLALLVLATSLSGWSLTHVPGNAVPSSKHYRESGVGNATGRSGSAHMTARTLLSKDGGATVEVTTGTLDSTGTPPGSFRKIQFKALSPAGDPLSVQNLFPPTATGYYSFASPLLHRAQQIQLQANIAGIDGNRTDVVTVVETVKLRPDLAVANLSFPSSAFANQPVNISANLVEMNGDAGATTTCVLAIDGNNVDQVRNVYVDAAGSVSCAFAYMFTTTGGHTIQVSATNVVPEDWDTNNNSNSGTIEITNPDTAEHSLASFEDTNGSFPVIASSTSKEWHLGTLIVDYSNTFGNTGRMQDSNTTFSSSGCTGSTNAVAWQFPVNVNYTESMDGTSVYSFADTGITGSSVSFPGNNSALCGGVDASEHIEIGSDSASDHWNFLQSHEYYDSAGNILKTVQTFQSERFSGDVTYFSYGFQCYYWSSLSGACTGAADYYVWNSPGEQVYGTIIPVGSTWVPSVAVVDAAGNTFSGSVSVPLSSTQHISNQPNTCQSQGPDANGYSVENCSSSENNYTITEGSVSN